MSTKKISWDLENRSIKLKGMDMKSCGINFVTFPFHFDSIIFMYNLYE